MMKNLSQPASLVVPNLVHFDETETLHSNSHNIGFISRALALLLQLSGLNVF